MFRRTQTAGVLLAISLGATVVSRLLQRHFGRTVPLIVVGQVLAAIGAAGFALWIGHDG
ncbi:hypothetical protein NKJ26_20285 [Mesorhizobium sp. M0152]|uniref:hypothetical protein n=1 Tax=unclassified Mesorhizobium TaxID=325217 RepID=UPI0033353741